MRKKILIVDDDADMVEMLTSILVSEGFSVATAPDGVTALKVAQTFSPHLILLDLALPELDGFTVCETLRKSRATAHIQVPSTYGDGVNQSDESIRRDRERGQWLLYKAVRAEGIACQD